MALFGKSRGLTSTNNKQRPLKKSGHVQNAISNERAAKEYATKNQPVERDAENKSEPKIKRNINESQGGGQVKIFEHTGRVVDFTKGPCRRMNTREVEALGIEGLAIVGTKYDDHAMNQAPNNHKKENGPQICCRVVTGTKVPTHERHEQLDYQHKTVGNLTVAIYQCKADLKEFNDRYEDETTRYECNMRTRLQRQFLLSLAEARQRWKEYVGHVIHKGEKTDKTLQKSYLETMETTREASTLLDREIRAKLVEEIDKTGYPDNQAVNTQALRGLNTANDKNRRNDNTETIITETSEEMGSEEKKNEIVVGVDALRLWAEKNDTKGTPNPKT